MSTSRRFTRTRPILAAAAAGALALGGVVAVSVPAQAAPAFTSLGMGFSVSLDYDTGSCAQKSISKVEPPTVMLPDNGTTTKTQSGTQQLAPSNADPTTMTESVSQKVTAQTKAQGTRPVSVRIHSTLSAKTTATAGNTCASHSSAMSQLMFQFTTAQPLWLTIDVSKRGKAITFVQLMEAGNAGGAVQVDAQQTSSGTSTMLIPPGTYQGGVQSGFTGSSTTVSTTSAGESDISLAFAPMGSAVSKPSGTALGYTSLAGARSCSVHTLAVGVTKSTSKFKKIAKVSWSVNGKTVKTLKGKSLTRGAKAKLRIADTRGASVKATVKLKSGKTRTAVTSYRPCA